MRRCVPTALVVLLLATVIRSQPSQASPPIDKYATVNNVKLHYVDWGGSGETLLFLTPLGGDLVEQFGAIAPQFTDRFRVVGLTRRGHGNSDKPASGYDTPTLVRDIVAFLDLLKISRVHIAGHSFAGAEMTLLAATYPRRVSSLVYLDATADYKWQAQLAAEAGFGPPPDPVQAAILRGAAGSSPDFAKVQAPALNIVVVFDGPIQPHPSDAGDAAYLRFLKLVHERDVVNEQIRQFERNMKRGRVLKLRNTSHGGFLHEPEQLRIFVPAMRAFLLKP